jgi:hypothetical protein
MMVRSSARVDLGIQHVGIVTRKALDRLSGGFEVTSVIQAGKYDES